MQTQPIDFSRVDLGDLSTDGIVPMENFEDNELDQYLHSNPGAPRISGLPPPPPYMNNCTAVSTAPTWPAAYKLSSSASGHLQRIASSTVGAGQPGSLSPNTDLHSNSLQHGMSQATQQQQQAGTTGSISDGYQSGGSDASPHSVKIEHSPPLAATKFPYDMQTSRFPFSSLGTVDNSEVDYSSTDSSQFYGQNAGMYPTAAPTYQCMASAAGLRGLYAPGDTRSTPQMTVPPINANAQWDRFSRP